MNTRTSHEAEEQADRHSLSHHLQVRGLELDQRLAWAVAASSSTVDAHVLPLLLNTNPNLARHIDERKALQLMEAKNVSRVSIDTSFAATSPVGTVWHDIFLKSERGRTVSTTSYILSVLETVRQNASNFARRPFLGDVIAQLFLNSESANIEGDSRAAGFLERLGSDTRASDFQFILALEGNRIVFRVTSTLDDYVQQKDTGLLVPQRALLTHHNEQFASFTPEQICELEGLINDRSSKERIFQEFFERNPHFFRLWDHREVHPHVYLARKDDGPLVPDFILTDRELQRAMLIDLKLPRAKIIRRQTNRDRFAAAMMEARAQLLEYQDWFENRDNRDTLKARIGMSIYRPRLAVIIGRSSEFLDEFDRAKLRSREPAIDIVTYDDILIAAKRRKLFIERSAQ